MKETSESIARCLHCFVLPCHLTTYDRRVNYNSVLIIFFCVQFTNIIYSAPGNTLDYFFDDTGRKMQVKAKEQ